jgi:hypothetical protein
LRLRGVVWVWWCLVYGDDLDDELVCCFAQVLLLCSRRRYIRLVSRKLVVMIWLFVIPELCLVWQRFFKQFFFPKKNCMYV